MCFRHEARQSLNWRTADAPVRPIPLAMSARRRFAGSPGQNVRETAMTHTHRTSNRQARSSDSATSGHQMTPSFHVAALLWSQQTLGVSWRIIDDQIGGHR
jgi:hypothetical protein